MIGSSSLTSRTVWRIWGGHSFQGRISKANSTKTSEKEEIINDLLYTFLGKFLNLIQNLCGKYILHQNYLNQTWCNWNVDKNLPIIDLLVNIYGGKICISLPVIELPSHYACFKNMGRFVTLKKRFQNMGCKKQGAKNQEAFSLFEYFGTFFKVPDPQKISGVPDKLE